MKFYSFKLFFILKIVFLLLIYTQAQYTTAKNPIKLTSKKVEIKGKITSESGKPLSNVSVTLKGTQLGASTNEKGMYSFYASAGKYTLSVSSLGFKKKQLKVTVIANEILKVDVILKEVSENLGEVIVNGRKRKEQLILKTRTATKSNLSLMDTPAPIVVVSKSLLEQQANNTIQEAIRNVSGLTQAGNNYGVGDNLIIRGLDVNYAYDGMYGGGALGNNYNPTRTLTNVERIDILKGPSTGLYGTGSAGGVINMIEKKPLDFKQTNFEVQIGQWNQYKAMLDITAPITDNFSYRLVASKEAENGYRNLSSNRNEIYGSLKFNSSPKSKFILSTAYIDDKNQIDAIGDPVRILNKASLIDTDAGYVWQNLVNDFDADGDGIFGVQLTDKQRQTLANSITDGLLPYNLGKGNLISPLSEPNKGKEFRIKLKHNWKIYDNTTLTQQIQYRTYKSNFTRQTGAYNYVYWNRNGEINANPRAPLVIDDVLYPFAARRQEYRHQEAEEAALQYFADLQNTWKSGQFKGEHLLSVNFDKRDASLASWSIWDADGTATGSNPIPYILDIRNPNWPIGNFWDYTPSLRTNYDKDVISYGASLQEIINFNNKLTGRLGAAYSKIKQTYKQKTSDRNEATPEADTDDAGFTYNLGLNYRIADEFSAFVNYAKGRTAYGILQSVTGEDDRPDSESKSFDVGIRLNVLNKKVLISMVYFQTSRTNLRYANDLYNDNINDVEYNISVPQYFYDDKDQSKGFEFDINAVFDKHWSLNANSTYQDATIIRNNKEANQKGVPETYARVWGEYKHYFGKSQRPLKLNFGMRYESERTVNSAGFGLPDAYLESYVVWDAGASFDFKKLNVRLNIYNVFNKKYYSKAMFLGGLSGEPVNAQLTLKYAL